MPEKNHHHVCPYAAALSDDEDASHHAGSHQGDGGHRRNYDDDGDGDNNGNGSTPTPTPATTPTPTSSASSILSEARLRCPAFANGAPCPFRDCALDDPSSLVEVMRTVPPGHFSCSSSSSSSSSSPSSSSSVVPPPVSSVVSGGGKTHFQLAMEHVHDVMTRLSSKEHDEEEEGEKEYDRDSFVVRGGCPFKSYHDRGGADTTPGGNLARAMEDFSLAAIMGRMAEGRDDDDDDDDDDGAKAEEKEDSGGAGGAEADVAATAAAVGGSNVEDSPSRGGGGESGAPEATDGRSDEPVPPRQRPSPLSQALKTGTAASHAAAENVHFVRDFVNGKIDRESYKSLVTGLYHSYAALEGLLDMHAPAHFPALHFPDELGRTSALREDMDYWHGPDWESRLSSSLGPSPAVSDYANRMVEVGRHDPLLLLSHAYTRYLGDLSGGKILARIARRALNLGKVGDGGADGLRFYEFEKVRSAKLFKDGYRRALDELDLSSDGVRRLVAEANVAFALNMRVFEELDVMGGVPGARVRNVREALSYYDIEMDRVDRGGGARGGLGGRRRRSARSGSSVGAARGIAGRRRRTDPRMPNSRRRRREVVVRMRARVPRPRRRQEERRRGGEGGVRGRSFSSTIRRWG